MDYPRYDPASAVTPLDAAELDGLDRLLQRLTADGVMTLDGVDGFLTALVVGPRGLLGTLSTAEWLPLVWGGDDALGAAGTAPFASRRQRKDTVVLVLRHLRHLAEQFARAPGAWEPIFSIAEQGDDELADARDWCAGFLQAVDLAPGAWTDARPALWADPLLAPLLHLGGGLEDWPLPDAVAQADLDDAAACDALSRAVPEAVLHLHALHAPP